MDFQAKLENLRSKPDHIKRRYAFWSSLSFTSLVFVFWISSFASWGSTTTPVVAEAVNRAGSPGQSMVAAVGSFFVDIKDMVFGPKKMSYSNIEVLPGK